MPIDRKALLAKQKNARLAEALKVQAITFQLPAPGASSEWVAPVLLARADWLMVEAGVSDTVRQEFKAEALSGDYHHVLTTIQKWFRVEVRVDEYRPLTESITNYYEGEVNVPRDVLVDESDDPLDEDIAQALTDLEQRDEEQARHDAAIAKAQTELRQHLGLKDDETLVIKVVKNKA